MQISVSYDALSRHNIKQWYHPCIALPVWRTLLPVGFLVSKETVVLRQWVRWKQKFGFIKRVDKGWISTEKDLESWRFER